MAQVLQWIRAIDPRILQGLWWFGCVLFLVGMIGVARQIVGVRPAPRAREVTEPPHPRMRVRGLLRDALDRDPIGVVPHEEASDQWSPVAEYGPTSAADGGMLRAVRDPETRRVEFFELPVNPDVPLARRRHAMAPGLLDPEAYPAHVPVVYRGVVEAGVVDDHARRYHRDPIPAAVRPVASPVIVPTDDGPVYVSDEPTLDMILDDGARLNEIERAFSAGFDDVVRRLEEWANTGGMVKA